MRASSGKVSPDLAVAIDEAAANAVKHFRFLADLLVEMVEGNPVIRKQNGKIVEVTTATEAVQMMAMLINNVPNFDARTEGRPGGPVIIIRYTMIEIIAVRPDDSYSYKTLEIETPYSLKGDVQTSKERLLENIRNVLATVEPDFIKDVLMETAKDEIRAGNSFVSRRAHLLSKLPAVFEIVDNSDDTMKNESYVGEEVELRINYMNFPSAAIEVLNNSGDSIGFLAEKHVSGFGDRVLNDIAFLIDYLQARVVNAWPLTIEVRAKAC